MRARTGEEGRMKRQEDKEDEAGRQGGEEIMRTTRTESKREKVEGREKINIGKTQEEKEE